MTTSRVPLVSVVLCVYNGANYLQEQLDSILRQTYSNLEILILDDKSTDASVAILREYEEKHSNIQLIQNVTNLGFNKNFEKGISIAHGEFISICDQDDIWLPTKIEELVHNIGNASLIYSNSELIDEKGNSLNRTLEYKIVHVNNPTFKAFLDANFITGHTCLFNKNLLPYILPIPNSVNYYDKWIAMVASYVGKVKYYPTILTRYRVHNTSVIQQQKQIQESRAILRKKHNAEILAFINLNFIKTADKRFVERFLRKKTNAIQGGTAFFTCFLFLLKHHATLYPWYAKSFIKKLNFLRKQCL